MEVRAGVLQAEPVLQRKRSFSPKDGLFGENAEHPMAVMKVGAAGIETISGAMKRPKKQNGHNHGNYLVATHRKAATENPNCQRVYSFDADRYQRSTPISDDERLIRLRFKSVSQAVALRAKNLSTITADQAAFVAQKDTAGGKKTFKAYLWQVCGDAYDAEHPRD